LVFSRL